MANVKIKTGFFETKIYNLLMKPDEIILESYGESPIAIPADSIAEVYLRISGIPHPTFEFRMPAQSIEGELVNASDAEQFMVNLKRVFGRKAIVD